MLMSLEPAVAALCGLVLLHERLGALQWLAIAAVIVASVALHPAEVARCCVTGAMVRNPTTSSSSQTKRPGMSPAMIALNTDAMIRL